MSNIYEKQVLDEIGTPVRGVDAQDDVHAKKLAAKSAEFERMGNALYSQQLRTDAGIMLNNAYTQFANDPDSLEKAVADIRKGVLGTIARPDVAVDFLADYDLKSSSLVASARVKRENMQRAETKSTMSDALAANLGDLADAAYGVFSADDDDINIGYKHARQSAIGAINSKGNNGLNVFTDSERKSGMRNISKGSLTGLQTFLLDPTGDDNRKAEVIRRFNAGQYKDMFSEEDYPKALRLIKAAGKQLGGGSGGSGSSKKDDDETVAGEMLKIQLDDFKENNKDKWYSKADMVGLLDFRESASAMFETGRITSKEYGAIMKQSAPALAQKIDDYADKKLSWRHGDSDLQAGIKKIRTVANENGFSPDQRLFLYEDFMRSYRADTDAPAGEERFGHENREKARQAADKTIQRYIQDQYPNWDAKTVPAIVMGRTVYRTPTSASELASHKDYKIMEF